jgi:hypothetical protein
MLALLNFVHPFWNALLRNQKSASPRGFKATPSQNSKKDTLWLTMCVRCNNTRENVCSRERRGVDFPFLTGDTQKSNIDHHEFLYEAEGLERRKESTFCARNEGDFRDLLPCWRLPCQCQSTCLRNRVIFANASSCRRDLWLAEHVRDARQCWDLFRWLHRWFYCELVVA